MFLAKINRLNRFSGYKNNPGATRSKLLTDVFKKGDAYFVSGDLFTLHDKDYVSFADRLGDTFKWKGEVVSTHEVADVVFQFPGIGDANVYGVAVAGAEGRVGMAALTLAAGETLDLDALADHVTRNLPPYALPRMIRMLDQAEVTATFKQVKTRLKEEGFDPALIGDPLYFLDPETNRYVPLTPALFGDIRQGRVRF
jgi:acyl-CoA synthetase (AMP-forming)/AMP-acid ligase II